MGWNETLPAFNSPLYPFAGGVPGLLSPSAREPSGWGFRALPGLRCHVPPLSVLVRAALCWPGLGWALSLSWPSPPLARPIPLPLLSAVGAPVGFEPTTCGLRVLAQQSFSVVSHGLSCPFTIPTGLEETSLVHCWQELLPK